MTPLPRHPKPHLKYSTNFKKWGCYAHDPAKPYGVGGPVSLGATPRQAYGKWRAERRFEEWLKASPLNSPPHPWSDTAAETREATHLSYAAIAVSVAALVAWVVHVAC